MRRILRRAIRYGRNIGLDVLYYNCRFKLAVTPISFEIVDGAGIGSAMVANKVPGVRAAMAYDLSSARNGREHNDANVLTLGAGDGYVIGERLLERLQDESGGQI